MLFRYFDLPDSLLPSNGASIGGVILNPKWNKLGQTTVRLYPKALNYATCKYVSQSIQQS
jgi:hypothetical protein